MRKRLMSALFTLAKPFKRVVEWFIKRPKAARTTAAIFTPIMCFGCTALLLGGLPAAVMMVQVMIHEYAHWCAAQVVHVDQSWLPIFIPLVVGVMGKTFVKDDDPIKHRTIAMAGPIAGISLAVVWLVAGLLTGNNLFIAAGVIFGIVEVINAIFGSDGKKFRAAGRAMRLQTEEVIVRA